MANEQEQTRQRIHEAVITAWDSGRPDVRQYLENLLEEELLRLAGEKIGSNRTQIAKRLRLSRNTLAKQLRKHGLD